MAFNFEGGGGADTETGVKFQFLRKYFVPMHGFMFFDGLHCGFEFEFPPKSTAGRL